MSKKALLVILSLVFLAANVFAFDFNAGDSVQGKKLWKNYQLECADGTVLTKKTSASSKTQAQWKNAFMHPTKLPCNGQWKEGIKTEEDMQNVFRYLYDHAADSDHAETCG